jgi:hypothetical protein
MPSSLLSLPVIPRLPHPSLRPDPPFPLSLPPSLLSPVCAGLRGPSSDARRLAATSGTTNQVKKCQNQENYTDIHVLLSRFLTLYDFHFALVFILFENTNLQNILYFFPFSPLFLLSILSSFFSFLHTFLHSLFLLLTFTLYFLSFFLSFPLQELCCRLRDEESSRGVKRERQVYTPCLAYTVHTHAIHAHVLHDRTVHTNTRHVTHMPSLPNSHPPDL